MVINEVSKGSEWDLFILSYISIKYAPKYYYLYIRHIKYMMKSDNEYLFSSHA